MSARAGAGATRAASLSPEDSLRLNVLLENGPLAIRIDEPSMTLRALTPEGEASVRLHPTTGPERYLRAVREFLSLKVLGAPGGYPVYIRRWTRMGQERDTRSLERLLLLGEPEAVVAVVHAPGLTDELARRAWWAMPTPENARRMLLSPAVVAGSMGPVLAEYLLEWLPFEQEHQAMVEIVQLVLQPGLIGEEARLGLWQKARQRNSYYVGFLRALPRALPEPPPPHPQAAAAAAALAGAAGATPVGQALLELLSAQGQAFLATVELALRRPADQPVVILLFEAIEAYFAALRGGARAGEREPQAAQARAAGWLAGEEAGAPHGTREVAAALPEGLRPQLQALLFLAQVGEAMLDPIFGRTDAVGSVMRRRLEPVTGPLREALRALRP